MKNITKEWSKFNGIYEKCMQDIKLKDGTVLIGFWPNAGSFICMTNNNQKEIPIEDVIEVRLTHHKRYSIECNGE